MKNAVGSTALLALEHVAVGVAQHQRGGGDLRPVPAIGVDQEPVAADHAVLAGHRQREMVAHALVQAEPRRPAQRAGEVDPLLLQAVAHRPLLDRWTSAQQRLSRDLPAIRARGKVVRQ